MTSSIADWQRLAHALARERGEHSRACVGRKGTDIKPDCGPYCGLCNGIGRVEVNHKSPTRIASRLALIHLAISRAVECVAQGKMHTKQRLDCPACEMMHVDIGEWSTRLHHKHLCSFCGHVWRLEHHAFGCAFDKPEGFPIALADVFLNLCDFAESLGVEMSDFAPVTRHTLTEPEAICTQLNYVHECVSAFEDDSPQEDLSRVLVALRATAQMCGVDLLAMAELKFAYDKTRKDGRP